MTALTVWLIRHGQSTANAGQVTPSHGESPLTELGRQQALQAAAPVTARPDLIVVSPYRRAVETAAPIIEKWPGVPVQTWPIQEFTYLSPEKYLELNVVGRRPIADAYWQRADPHYRDGNDAESFAQFAARLEAFHERLLALKGFIIVVGHGQFFHAYKLALERGLNIAADWMRHFRGADLLTPIGNGEIVIVEPADITLVEKN